MEQSILNIISKGDPLSIVALFACITIYVVIRYQRKNTAESRDAEIATLTTKIKNFGSELEKTNSTVYNLQTIVNELETEKKLLQKDVNYLISETTGIKEDIKEMKNTLNSMALSLERIAAKYDNGTAPTTKKG